MCLLPHPLQPTNWPKLWMGLISEFGLSWSAAAAAPPPEHDPESGPAGRRPVQTTARRSSAAARDLTSRAVVVGHHRPSLFAQYSVGSGYRGVGRTPTAPRLFVRRYRRTTEMPGHRQSTRPATCAHLLVCAFDYVGPRRRPADRIALASSAATASTLPLMLDSTEPRAAKRVCRASGRPLHDSTR